MHARMATRHTARIFAEPRAVMQTGGVRQKLHALVIRASASLGRNPGDDLVWVGNVAGLAVHAVGWVQADAFSVWSCRVVEHLVDIGGTEVLAGAAEFLDAALLADVGVVNDKMSRLVFFVAGSGVVEIGELIEGELAVALGRPEQVGFRSAVGGQIAQLVHVLEISFGGIAVAQTAP